MYFGYFTTAGGLVLLRCTITLFGGLCPCKLAQNVIAECADKEQNRVCLLAQDGF